jgi:Glycopeptide antibiotics resistance protein
MQSKKLTQGLFVIYLLALTWIILFKLQFSFENLDHIRNINLIPFGGSVIVNGVIDFDEIINNAVAFIPFGVFMCMLQREKSFFQRIAPIFLASLFFETVQFIFAIGASDITDLITNTFGGVIGIGIFFIFSKIFKEKVYKVINIVSLIAAVVITLFSVLLLTRM